MISEEYACLTAVALVAGDQGQARPAGQMTFWDGAPPIDRSGMSGRYPHASVSDHAGSDLYPALLWAKVGGGSGVLSDEAPEGSRVLNGWSWHVRRYDQRTMPERAPGQSAVR